MNEPAAVRRPGWIDGLRPDRRWLAVMTTLTLAELAWWGWVWRVGIAPAPLIGTYLLLAVAGLAAALVVRFALRLGPPAAPWPAIVGGTVLAAIGASMFLPLKYAIPGELPFWLDQPLATLERGALGCDPWLLLDRLFGWAAVPMDLLYGSWLPTQTTVLFLVILAPPSREKEQALIVYSLAWFVLGVVGAVLLSSAGPLFYDRLFGGSAFSGLSQTLRARHAWIAIAESDRMWRSMSMVRPGLVAGISAMPSIHVAISMWLVLTARAMAPRLTWPALIYCILIWVGSVQLGWHYVSDGLVGMLGTAGLWMLVLRLNPAPSTRGYRACLRRNGRTSGAASARAASSSSGRPRT